MIATAYIDTEYEHYEIEWGVKELTAYLNRAYPVNFTQEQIRALYLEGCMDSYIDAIKGGELQDDFERWLLSYKS